MTKTTALVVIGATLAASCATSLAPRTAPPLRGIYGGVPQEILDNGTRLRDFGIDAVWLGSGSFTPERLALLRAEGVQVYAEFNTLHVADYLKEHPDAAPIGADGRVSPPPQGWQGICPTHEAYRRFRMDAFRKLLQDFADRRRVARLPPQPRELGAGRAGHAGHLLLRSMPAALPGGHGDPAARRAGSPSARPSCCRHIARPGSAGGWMSSRTGSASSARSSTPPGRRRCWARSTMRGATRTSAGRGSRSWRST